MVNSLGKHKKLILSTSIATQNHTTNSISNKIQHTSNKNHYRYTPHWTPTTPSNSPMKPLLNPNQHVRCQLTHLCHHLQPTTPVQPRFERPQRFWRCPGRESSAFLGMPDFWPHGDSFALLNKDNDRHVSSREPSLSCCLCMLQFLSGCRTNWMTRLFGAVPVNAERVQSGWESYNRLGTADHLP